MSGPRSLLIMPANREDMLTKAPTYGADALIFDLEDSVPVAEKTKARALARDFIGRHKADNRIYVRVNGLQTGLIEDDLDAIVVEGLAGIRLPKAESAEAMRTVDRLLTDVESERRLDRASSRRKAFGSPTTSCRRRRASAR
jgi:citrate lyase subunit beta/citryl-CoA lyase